MFIWRSTQVRTIKRKTCDGVCRLTTTDEIMFSPFPYYNVIVFVQCSLDWEYTELLKDISIDLFEKSRVGARRHGNDLIIPAQIRANFLVQRGCETSAIFQACREVQDARRRRRETLELDKKKVRKACPPRGGYYSSVVRH